MPGQWAELEAEILLPDQIFGTSIPYSGELRLMFAVLTDALEVITRRRSARPRERTEAIAWVDESGVEWPFAFEAICHAFGLSAERIRVSLTRLAAERERSDSCA